MSAKDLFKQNLKAIISLKKLEKADVFDEKVLKSLKNDISLYTGFGGCTKAFYRNVDKTGAYKGWEDEAQELSDAVTEEEYSQIRLSTQNAFYTPPEITDKIYSQLALLGVDNDDLEVFEPGCGTGNFLFLMPDDFKFKKYLGVELDSITARIATQLYSENSEIKILNENFSNISRDPKYDLIIGNPPFGNNKIDGKSIHNYFVEKGIETLKPGGVLAFVITHSFLDTNKQHTRDKVFETADLISAERLNQEAFKHTGTDVNTDILFFQKLSPEQQIIRSNALESRKTGNGLTDVEAASLKKGDGWLKAEIQRLDDGDKVASVNRQSFDNGELFFHDGVLKIKKDRFGKSLYSTRSIKSVKKDLGGGELTNINEIEKIYNDKRSRWQDNNKERFDSKSFKERTTVSQADMEKIEDNTLDGQLILVGTRESYNTSSMLTTDYFSAYKPTEVGRLSEGSFVSKKDVLDSEISEEVKALIKNSKTKMFVTLKKEFFATNEEDVEVIRSETYIKPHLVLKKQAGDLVDNEKAYNVLEGYTRLRDLTTNILEAESEDETLIAEESRKLLNEEYDDFVQKYGFVNNVNNKRFYEDDPLFYRVLVLEDYDKGISSAISKKTGEPERAESAKKSKVFTERLLSPIKEKDMSAASIEDLLQYSIGFKGSVDIGFMAKVAQRIGEESDISKSIVKEGLVFLTTKGEYVEKSLYCSGDVKKTIDEIDCSISDGVASAEDSYGNVFSLSKNKEALEKALPARIKIHELEPNLGEAWIPADIIEDFASNFLYKDEAVTIEARHIPTSGKWAVGSSSSYFPNTDFCTKRLSAFDILNGVLNHKALVVKDHIGDGKYVVNTVETTLAQEKLNLIKSEFSSFILRSPEYIRKVEDTYNDRFNRYVAPVFDTPNLLLEGKVDDDVIDLRPTQKNAVTRIIKSDTTLLDHTVGLGKTYTMVSAAMELRRLGLSKKPLFVVPNHIIVDFAKAFAELYPNSKVLVPSKKNLKKENRLAFFEKVRVVDCDAVILGHSHFKFLDVSYERKVETIQDTINDFNTSIAALNSVDGVDGRAIAIQERQREVLNKKLEEMMSNSGKKDEEALTIEKLGFDSLFLDEAHLFKNLGFPTSMTRIAGLGSTDGSQMAMDLFLKIQHLKDISGKVIFATGTPISNSMAELYTMQRYLDLDSLHQMGVAHFDSWQSVFASVTSEWELSPTGMDYRLVSRFARFNKVPELMSMYRKFADVVTKIDLKRAMDKIGQKILIPVVNGGKPANIIVNKNEYVAEYMIDIVERAMNPPSDPSIDNMLKIMSDARKAALDYRLIDSSVDISPEETDSKLFEVADNIIDIYETYTGVKGVQLVFIDLSTPKSSASPEKIARFIELGKLTEDEAIAIGVNFNAYDEIKKILISGGVKENEIAYIHHATTDLKKDELYAKVRSGSIRVLLGSTSKMGAGMNVQDRLVALHHVDAPWRPSDLEQREGRILRQGNIFYEADPEGFQPHVLRYATEETLDSRMWQTIESKAVFIEQFRSGNLEGRTMSEVNSEAMSAAEMKAVSSGNPLVLEEIKLSSDIKGLERLKRSNMSMIASNNAEISSYKKEVERGPSRILAIKNLVEILANNLPPEDKVVEVLDAEGQPVLDKNKKVKTKIEKADQEIFVYDVYGKKIKHTNYIKAAADIISYMELNQEENGVNPIFSYRGVDFDYTRDWEGDFSFYPRDHDVGDDCMVPKNMKESGFFTRINNYLFRFTENKILAIKAKHERNIKDLAYFENKKISAIFTKDKEVELRDLINRHDEVLIILKGEGEDEEGNKKEKIGYRPNLYLVETNEGMFSITALNSIEDSAKYSSNLGVIQKNNKGAWELKDYSTAQTYKFECKYQAKLKAQALFNPKYKDAAVIDYSINDIDNLDGGGCVIEGDFTEEAAQDIIEGKQTEMVFASLNSKPEDVKIKETALSGWFV